MARPRLRLRQYRAGDENAFIPRADFAAEREAVGWDWGKGAPGQTWTVIRGDNEVVGVAGLVDRGDGAFEAWALLADLPARCWPKLLWLAGNTLDVFEFRHLVRQIHAYAGFEAAANCLAKLGFRAVTYEDWCGVGAYALMRRGAT